MAERELLFGIEIEAEYNARLLRHITKGGHHRPRQVTENWFAEDDGSVDNTGNRDMNGWDTIELVSFAGGLCLV